MARSKVFDEESVLNKAVDLFWCKGYQGTSAQDLVDGLGISRSSLYDTYGDKRTLYIKTLQKYRNEVVGEVIRIINETEDVKETIKHIFLFNIKASLEDPSEKGCFMVNCTIELNPTDTEISTILVQNSKNLETALTAALERGQLSGKISQKQSALALARFVQNNITGIRVTAKTQKDPKALEDIMNMTLSVLD